MSILIWQVYFIQHVSIFSFCTLEFNSQNQLRFQKWVNLVARLDGLRRWVITTSEKQPQICCVMCISANTQFMDKNTYYIQQQELYLYLQFTSDFKLTYSRFLQCNGQKFKILSSEAISCRPYYFSERIGFRSCQCNFTRQWKILVLMIEKSMHINAFLREALQIHDQVISYVWKCKIASFFMLLLYALISMQFSIILLFQVM